MAFPVSPINGATTLVNGINYVYSSASNSWTRIVASLGNLTVAGNVNADSIYTIQGLYWAGNSQPVVGAGTNILSDPNPPPGPVRPGDQWYATDIGVLFEYINDGDSDQWVDITSAAIAAGSVINLSSGDFAILGNITPGLSAVYDLGNVSYKWRDLHVGGTAILSNATSTSGYFWANGAPAFYSNTWVGQYLPNYTGNVAAGNVDVTGKIVTASGVFWANGVPAVYSDTAVAQYLPTYTGNVGAGNITATGNVTSANVTTGNITATGNVTSANTITGNITATGNVTSANTITGNITATSNVNILGNLAVTQAITASSNVIILGNLAVTQAITSSSISTTGSVTVAYTPGATIGAAYQATGKDTQGGIGYFDFLKATNTTSGATNPNKTIRLNNTGALEVINNAYTATLLSLSDAGAFSVPGPISVSGKKAVNGPAFSAYAEATLQTITSGSQQKVLFQTEEFDTDNCYSSSRFTPNVEGYYQLNAQVRLDGATSTGEMMIVLYRNGTEYKRGTNQQGTQIAANFWAMTISSVAYADGIDDYFEIYVQQGSGGTVSVTAVNAQNITWFNGCMLRGA